MERTLSAFFFGNECRKALNFSGLPMLRFFAWREVIAVLLSFVVSQDTEYSIPPANSNSCFRRFRDKYSMDGFLPVTHTARAEFDK